MSRLRDIANVDPDDPVAAARAKRAGERTGQGEKDDICAGAYAWRVVSEDGPVVRIVNQGQGSLDIAICQKGRLIVSGNVMSAGWGSFNTWDVSVPTGGVSVKARRCDPKARWA